MNIVVKKRIDGLINKKLLKELNELNFEKKCIINDIAWDLAEEGFEEKDINDYLKENKII